MPTVITASPAPSTTKTTATIVGTKSSTWARAYDVSRHGPGCFCMAPS